MWSRNAAFSASWRAHACRTILVRKWTGSDCVNWATQTINVTRRTWCRRMATGIGHQRWRSEWTECGEPSSNALYLSWFGSIGLHYTAWKHRLRSWQRTLDRWTLTLAYLLLYDGKQEYWLDVPRQTKSVPASVDLVGLVGRSAKVIG